MKSLKFAQLISLSLGLSLVCSCSVFEVKHQPGSASMVPPKPLAIPVGKNWQVIEEAPNLSDERAHVPFQTEQSLQPAGVSPVPTENRIETPRQTSPGTGK
jgi:hypothetical protein